MRLQAAVKSILVGADVWVGRIIEHLVEVARRKLDGLQHLQRVLVDGAEVALQAILRVDLILAIGDRGGSAKDDKRKDDRGREQPVQRPFGAPVLARGRWRQNVSQETLHFGRDATNRAAANYGEPAANSISAAMRESSSSVLPLRARR